MYIQTNIAENNGEMRTSILLVYDPIIVFYAKYWILIKFGHKSVNIKLELFVVTQSPTYPGALTS